MMLHRAIRYVFKWLVALLWPTKVIGRKNLKLIPKGTGFVVMAGPHTTEFESIWLSFVLWRYDTHFYAKAEYWTKNRMRGWLLSLVGQIPVERSGRGMIEVTHRGAKLVQQGHVVVVYPNGTRAKDGKTHKGHNGAVRTAMEAGKDVYVVPIAIVGMADVNPSGSGMFIRPGRGLQAVIGKPILPAHHSRLAGLEELLLRKDKFAQVVTDHVMREIAGMSGTDYDDTFLPLHGG